MDNFASFANRGCYICNKREEVLCYKCFESLISYENKNLDEIALYRYNETASKILLMSKYPPYYFYILKHLIMRTVIEFNYPHNTLLCSIPLSSLKMYERKFNQAELISSELSKKLDLNHQEILIRKTDTKPLFSLDKAARVSELRGIFKPKLISRFLINSFPNVVLVDDLRTTGETLRQAKKVLLQAGFKKVSFLTLFAT